LLRATNHIADVLLASGERGPMEAFTVFSSVTVGCRVVSYKSNERVDARPVALDLRNNATLNADQQRTKTIDQSGNRSVVRPPPPSLRPDRSHRQPRHGRICEIEATAVTIKYQQAHDHTRRYSGATAPDRLWLTTHCADCSTPHQRFAVHYMAALWDWNNCWYRSDIVVSIL